MATFDPTQPEVWYPVRDFAAYKISSHLRLQTSHSGPKKHHRKRPPRVIKIHSDDRGYKKLILWRDGKYHNIYLHQVVAELAYGPCPEGLIVRHLDDDKGNNWPSNLAYGTQVENMADAKRNGTARAARGEEHGHADLSDQIILAIRRLHGYGLPASILGPSFGLTNKYVSVILRGGRWPHVADLADAAEKVGG